MSCNGFKGGIGTSSRQIPKTGGGHYTLGILVQCNYSGDLTILGAPVRRELQDMRTLCMLSNDALDPYFRATIDATEEAVVNAMLAAETMTGADGLRATGLPGDRLVEVLRKYKRMPER